jgi:hypothetical protein
MGVQLLDQGFNNGGAQTVRASVRADGKAYLIALITSSVTIRPMLTALSEPIMPSSAVTVSTMGWLSPIIDAARLSHSLDEIGPTSIWSMPSVACRC